MAESTRLVAYGSMSARAVARIGNDKSAFFFVNEMIEVNCMYLRKVRRLNSSCWLLIGIRGCDGDH